MLGVKAPRRTLEAAVTLRRRNRLPGVTPLPAPFAARGRPSTGAISGRRKLAFTQVALDDVKTIKNALGGTVNDVVLALCAGALRSYLLARHELPAESLVAMVPISVRTEELRGAMGNQVSQMLVSLEIGRAHV